MLIFGLKCWWREGLEDFGFCRINELNMNIRNREIWEISIEFGNFSWER